MKKLTSWDLNTLKLISPERTRSRAAVVDAMRRALDHFVGYCEEIGSHHEIERIAIRRSRGWKLFTVECVGISPDGRSIITAPRRKSQSKRARAPQRRKRKTQRKGK